jgi:hypothetical protein
MMSVDVPSVAAPLKHVLPTARHQLPLLPFEVVLVHAEKGKQDVCQLAEDASVTHNTILY